MDLFMQVRKCSVAGLDFRSARYMYFSFILLELATREAIFLNISYALSIFCVTPLGLERSRLPSEVRYLRMLEIC